LFKAYAAPEGLRQQQQQRPESHPRELQSAGSIDPSSRPTPWAPALRRPYSQALGLRNNHRKGSSSSQAIRVRPMTRSRRTTGSVKGASRETARSSSHSCDSRKARTSRVEHRHSVQGGDQGVPPWFDVEEQATLEMGRDRSGVFVREQEGVVLVWAVRTTEKNVLAVALGGG
jgi:hypothetical protein